MCGPLYRLDHLLGDAAVVTKQGHVRRVLQVRPATESGIHHFQAERLLEPHQRGNATVSLQDEGPVARRAAETRRGTSRGGNATDAAS